MSRDEHTVLIRPSGETAVVVSSEHGGNRVPRPYRALFRGSEAVLATHRGWDPGTADLARRLAGAFGAEALIADTTRLLADLNRSAHHPRVFSEITRSLPQVERVALLERWHEPHRGRVHEAVAAAMVRRRTVLHLAVHSFTPVLDGRERRADLALLYDPSRPRERGLAERWCAELRTTLPGVRVRRNYPYRGRSDGLTTTLRARFPAERYLGMEIEVNQKLLDPDGRFPAWVGDALVASCPLP